jgi:hypothetical protein
MSLGRFAKVVGEKPCFLFGPPAGLTLAPYSETCSNLLSRKFGMTRCVRLPNYQNLLNVQFYYFETTFY